MNPMTFFFILPNKFTFDQCYKLFLFYSLLKNSTFQKRTEQLLRSRGIYKKLGKFPENFLKFLNRIFANFKGLAAANFLKKLLHRYQ